MKQREDPFDLQALRVDPNDGELIRLAKVPAKVQKRRGHFIKVPWVWFEKLGDAHGQTYRLALYLYSTCIGRTVPISRLNCQMSVYEMLAFRDNLNGGCWPTWNA